MNKATLANPNHTLGVTTPALTGRCCGSPVFVPPTPAASHGVSTLRLSSPYLQYDSNGTFRNVPLLLSHACPCAGGDAYGKPHIVLAVDGDKVHQPTPKDRVEFIHQVSLRQGFQKGFDGSPSGLFAADCLIQRFI